MSASFPSFEAELGYAVARGSISLTLADASILARYKDMDEAQKHALEVRRAAETWRHIAEHLRIRIRDEVRAYVKSHAPKNVILARAHDINRSHTLPEQEVNNIVVAEVYEALPDAPRCRRGQR